MRDAGQLDGLVRKEAKALLAAARGLLTSRKRRSPRHDELRVATEAVSAALDKGDLAAVRRTLPVLDGLVDELSEPAGKSVLREYTESISIAIVIALVLRAFIIEAFTIPSGSMYPTLMVQDYIFVSKFIYGVRLPMSDKKILQVRPPKRGEVAVFMWPCNNGLDYIKRIVALAGDTVEMRCNVLHVNGKPVTPKLVSAHETYVDDNRSPHDVVRFRETLGDNTYDTYQTRSYSLDFPDSSAEAPSCQWPGHEKVDPNHPPQVLGTIVRNPGADPADPCAPRMHFVVPPGHVFGVGDNRAFSNDSRRWGAIPLGNLKGKALFIWLSYNKEQGLSGIRWSRMGNLVR